MNRVTKKRKTTGDSARRGVILICAMVCLSVSAAMLITTTRRSVMARRHGIREHQQRQTEWLLHGGVRRAVSRLEVDDGYDGETWSPKGAYPDFAEVSVDIRVVSGPNDGDPDRDDPNSGDSDGSDSDRSSDASGPADGAGDRHVEIVARLGRFDRVADRTQCSTRFQFSTRSTTGSANSE